MEFHEQLNKYMDSLGVSGKELAAQTGISQSLISRYRTGERVPPKDGESLGKLAKGLVSASGNCWISEEEIESKLRSSERAGYSPDISVPLNRLIQVLEINASRMAQTIHYDSSYISKVRKGKRKPSDIEQFCRKIIEYVAERYQDDKSMEALRELPGFQELDFGDLNALKEKLTDFFLNYAPRQESCVGRFLEKVDRYETEKDREADKNRNGSRMELPVHYFGTAEIKEGLRDFFEYVLLSDCKEPVLFFGDLLQERETDKQIFFGIQGILKKGIPVRIIRNGEYSVTELIAETENILALYMTGPLSCSYLKGRTDSVYQHLHGCSETVALSGECIKGELEKGHFYLTDNRKEVVWKNRHMEQLFEKAKPFLESYSVEQEEKRRTFLKKESEKSGKRRRILSGPPLFTLSKEQFLELLKQKETDIGDREALLFGFLKEKRELEELLERYDLEDTVCIRTEEDYKIHPTFLCFPGISLSKKIRLTFEEYETCLEAAREYAKRQENYQLTVSRNHGFDTIRVTIHEGHWCMISKENASMVHLVIRHPNVCREFEDFRILGSEK